MENNRLKKNERKEKLKHLIGNTIIILSIIGGIYIGVWLMFIKPIIDVCRAYDAGTLTGLMIGIAVLKCLFSGLGGFIFYIGAIIGSGIKYGN